MNSIFRKRFNVYIIGDSGNDRYMGVMFGIIAVIYRGISWQKI